MNKEKISSHFRQPLSQWIKTIVWSIIYILFITWVGNFWWLLLLPLILDAFISKFIPWTWWKKSKNPTILFVMGWIDAIVFALVAVYFINTFVFQNYQIPTSSLEKSLMVGDFLFVSKASYGPRVPNTPLSFPLVQHTFPIIETKSYLVNPQWDYKRLKGFDTIKRNDIVVFNFPTGDTVPVKQQNPDYYTLCHLYGRDAVRNRTDIFGEIVYRPVDRRENYVKRCVAIAGDWLTIKDNQVYVNGNKQEDVEGLQFNYYVQTDGSRISDEKMEEMNISKDDRVLIIQPNATQMRALGLDSLLPVYHFPLTKKSFEQMKTVVGVRKIVIEPYWMGGEVFPLGGGKTWSRDNYGPIWVPRKGAQLALNSYNFMLYERIIRVYENNTLEKKGTDFYINGELAKTYTFKMNYYWMMGDNRHNSADSRYWGFVPEDHVVGRPVVVWLSLDKDKSWFTGKIRWNRFLRDGSK